MSKKRYVNSDSFVYNQVRHGDNPGGKSMTLPGQSFTVEELMTRYGGLPMGIVPKRDFVDEDQDFDDPDVSKIPLMDPTERHIAMQENAEKMRSIEDSLQEQVDEQERQEAELAAKKDESSQDAGKAKLAADA